MTKHQLAKGTKFETPYYVFRGKSKGNTVMVTAGVHGSEKASIEGANRLLDQLQKKLLRLSNGVLIIVPIVNQNAYKKQSRGVPDLNRTFPRKRDGAARHPLSTALFRLAEQFRPTWYIDLHEATGLSKINPNVLGQTLITNPKSKAIPSVRRVIGRMNRSIKPESRHFTIRLHRLPGSGRTAADILLDSNAITVETSCYLPMAVRVNFQIKILRNLLNEAGMLKKATSDLTKAKDPIERHRKFKDEIKSKRPPHRLRWFWLP